MKQLTLGALLDFAAKLRRTNISLEEFRSLPIYIGNDDELNGVHCAWDIGIVDTDDKDEDSVYLVEMINEDYGNIKLDKGKAVIIC